MMWTNNPVRDAERYIVDCEERGKKRKHCDHCGVILSYGDEYYLINDEELCPECVKDEYGKVVNEWEDE